MNLLLDTHTLIWLLEGDVNLSKAAKEQIENPDNFNFVSITTFWEIAIKISLNKLDMRISIHDLKQLIWENGLDVLPITIEQTLFVSQLPFYHKDPFDRLLVAQAKIENLVIVSRDDALKLYNANYLVVKYAQIHPSINFIHCHSHFSRAWFKTQTQRDPFAFVEQTCPDVLSTQIGCAQRETVTSRFERQGLVV